jgi:hypothetical protein
MKRSVGTFLILPSTDVDLQGHVRSGVNFQTIKSFFEGDVASDGFSTPALRAKASALFERADQLANNWDSSKLIFPYLS